MRYFLFILKSALFDFKRNKLRTFLTSLGIMIGVASVVLLIALGLGLKRYIKQQFENLGTNLVFILPGSSFKTGNFRASSGMIGGARFDTRDLRALKKLPYVRYVVPAFMKTVEVSSPLETKYTDLYTTSNDVFVVRNLVPEEGTVFGKSDVVKRAKVAVLGPKIARELFGSEGNALHQIIRIEGTGFRVIGILEPKGGGGFGGPDFDSFVYIPYTTGYIFNSDKKFFSIYLKVEDSSYIDVVKNEAEKILLKRYHSDDFSVVKQDEIISTVTSIFSILNMGLVMIGAISLIVGGVGIMNIMYVSVTERTREIGIRRALGAQKKDILFHFLMEAVILSVFGGVVGVLIAYAIVYFIQIAFPAYISIHSVVVALIVSSLIGIVFGVFPARKASNLSPIEAIRYE